MKRYPLALVLFLNCAALVYNAHTTDILMNRGNLTRTGLNSTETVLTPALVSSSSFGPLYNNPVDGQVYAQVLYVSNQSIIVQGQSRKKHNVLYVATENDSLYAFDADSGVRYWKTSVAPAGETSVPSTDLNSTDLQPLIGITSTPVIDRSAGPNGTIFLVAMTKNATTLFYRIHAIDLATGQDRLTPAIVSASVPGMGPADTFNPQFERNRAGLLLLNGIIYTCWASFNDNPPFSGWIIAYNENNLATVGIFNTDPNGNPSNTTDPLLGSGNGIWQAANGPSVDSEGHVFVATGNGPFDSLNSSGFPALGDYGDSVLKLNMTGGISVFDYFTPFNQAASSDVDRDLASGGPMVLDIAGRTGVVSKLLYQAGKDGNIYLLNRNSLGKFNPNNNNQIYQEIPNGVPNGVWSSPAYFNGSIYAGLGPLGGTGPLIQLQFDFTNPESPLLRPTPASSTQTQFGYPGATPTISSNGTTNGIVWAYERNNGQAILHAYDATNLQTELFNSGTIGGAIKFAVPTVCNGKVFVGTSSSIAAFGGSPGKSHHLAKK
jgi:hypothetical protein